MTTTPKVLFESKLAESAETVQYTATNCKASIDKLTAANVSGANVTLTVHLVPPAGAAGPANAIIKQIAPGTTWPFPSVIGHILEAGGAISTIASVAGAVSIRASGREFT